MRLTAALSFAVYTAAMASPSPLDNCFSTHHASVSASSQCGDRVAISSCLSRLSKASSHADLESCYVVAGCSATAASTEAESALERCAELQEQSIEDGNNQKNNVAELRRRAAFAMPSPTPTTGPKLRFLDRREARHGDDCFDFDPVTTTVCPVQTNDGKVTTLSCTDTTTSSSSCLAHFTCTVDRGGGPICMKLENSLDIGGIIIAIVFAAGVVLGIAFITFMGCRESREQKRIAARAEASALARAATKKQRAQDRVPLMRQQDGPGAAAGGGHGAMGGSADPFNDGNHA